MEFKGNTRNTTLLKVKPFANSFHLLIFYSIFNLYSFVFDFLLRKLYQNEK